MVGRGRDETRALTREELELCDRARYPELGSLDDRSLAALIEALRMMRAQPRPAHAPKPAGGTRTRSYYLGAALRRAQDEARRRMDALRVMAPPAAKRGMNRSDAERPERATLPRLRRLAL